MPPAAEPRSAAPVGLAVVGASAGGVEALIRLVEALPAGLGCPVVVVLHVAPTAASALAQVLERAGPLPAATVRDGDELRAGCLHVAPPDRHVLVSPTRLELSSGPEEHGFRPAVDPAMRSAAEAFGAAAVGIVLSGSRVDGSAGLAAIKARGGRALVQDPEEAIHPGMPRSAIQRLAVDAVLSAAGLAGWLAAAAPGAR